jgi:hypothetical protein
VRLAVGRLAVSVDSVDPVRPDGAPEAGDPGPDGAGAVSGPAAAASA